MWSQIAILSLIVVLSVEFVEGVVSCENAVDTKTRVFQSLLQYQSNKIPFRFGETGYEGSAVEFNFTIENLERNDFNAFGSNSISTLILTAKKIKQIKEGAFSTLQCLRKLYLNKNSIASLVKDVFSDLEHVEILDLSENNLTLLHEYVFANLGNLKVLDLSRNSIRDLHALTFDKLAQLSELDLEFNHIKFLGASVFTPLANLHQLNLAFNRLRDVEFERIEGLKSLTDLNIAGNRIHRFDPVYEFAFHQLKTLNLSFNELTELNVENLRINLPNLELLDFNDNGWLCDELRIILHQFRDSKIKLFVRNESAAMSEDGIACSVIPTTTTSSPLQTTASMWVDKEFLAKYVEVRVTTYNRKNNNSIRYLTIAVIILYILFLTILVYEFLVKRYFKCPIPRRLDLQLADNRSDTDNFNLEQD